jgi:hypothetical protein
MKSLLILIFALVSSFTVVADDKKTECDCQKNAETCKSDDCKSDTAKGLNTGLVAIGMNAPAGPAFYCSGRC